MRDFPWSWRKNIFKNSGIRRHTAYLGVDDAARAWFTSFLTNRKQVTSYNDLCTETASVSIGVAQGSILGPLLFINFMKDLLEALQYCHVTLYADDTVLYFASKSVMDLESKINADLGRVCKWLPSNQLTLYASKCKFLFIGSSFHLSKVESICILLMTPFSTT